MEAKVPLRLSRLMPEDSFTIQEKRRQLQVQLPVSIFLLMLAVAGAITAIILRSYDPRGPGLICAIAHTSVAALALASIFWDLLWMRKLALSSSATHETSETGLSRIIFIFSLICFFAVLCFTIILSSNHQFVADYYTAEKGTSGLVQFMEDYKNVEVALIVLSVISLPLIACTLYTGYAMTGSVSTIRLTLYVIGFVQIGLILYLIYLCRGTLRLSKTYSIKKLINFWAVKVLLSIAILSVFITVLAFFANLKRIIKILVFIGFFSILILFICTAVEGVIYKNINQIKQAYFEDCAGSLQKVPKSLLSLEGCREKYSEINNSPFLSCPKAEQAVAWEDEQDLELTKRQNKLACLNMSCCGVASMHYRSWLSRLVSTNICFLAASFCLVSCCFFLSNKLGSSRTLSQLSELVLVVGTIILIVSALAFIFSDRFSISNERIQILSGGEVGKGENILELAASDYNALEKYSKLAEYDSSLRCYKVNEIREKNMYIAQIDDDSCMNLERGENNRKVCNDGLQVILLLKKATYRLPANLNSKHLRFYDNELYKKIFPDLKQPDNNFIGFEGFPEHINQFIESKLEICPLNLPQNIEIYVFEKQSPLKPFVTSPPSLNAKLASTAPVFFNKEAEQNASRHNPFPIKEHRVAHDPLQIKLDWATQNSQKALNQMNFGDIHVYGKNIFNNASEPNARISVLKDLKSCKKSDFLKDEVFLTFELDSLGEKAVYNIPHGKYTLYVEKEGFQISCAHIDVYTRKMAKIFVYLLPRLKKGQVAVVLTHGGHLDLNLFSSFAVLNREECIVGYFSRNCGGVSFYGTVNKGHIAQAVVIETLSKTNYLFHVSEHISNATKSKRDTDLREDGSEINDEFLSSDAQFRIYAGELDFPAEEKTTTPFPTKDWEEVRSDPRLAYLYACFNGETSLVAKPVDQFWTLSIWDRKKTLPGKKKPGDMFPNSKICEGF